MYLGTEDQTNWWVELAEFVAAIAQPLIVMALVSLVGIWVNFGKKLTEAAKTADKALELAESTSRAVGGLGESVERLNETLHAFDIHNTRVEGKLEEMEERLDSLSEAKHKLNNMIYIHETKLALLDAKSR